MTEEIIDLVAARWKQLEGYGAKFTEDYLRELWLECSRSPEVPDYIVVSNSTWNSYIQIVNRGYIARRCFRRNGRQVINWL